MNGLDEIHDKIAELEDRIEQLEQQNGAESGENQLLDRYDQYVVGKVDDVATAHPRRLMTLYDESGVVDRQKKKRRAKRLKKVVTENE